VLIDTIAPYRREDEAKIPRRDWIMPGLLLRKHITVLVAPSGSGKSLLTLQIGIACAQGKPWAGWRPRRKFRVLIINSEDDADEIQRRLMAATYRMPEVFNGDPDAYIENFRIIDATRSRTVIATFNNREKKLIRVEPKFHEIVSTIKHGKFDLVFVDPFAETFDADENSNNDLKWAGSYWRDVARETGTALCLVHHTKKYATGMAGDVDAARGAGALIGIARIVSTLFPMTAKEAEAMGITADKRSHYLRYDDAKANLNIISPFARWFHKDTITLDNAGEELPGDEVGVLVPWQPKGPSILEAQIVAFFNRIDAGMLNDEGKPTGEFYTFQKAGRGNDRYIGFFAKDFLQLETLSQAEKLITAWRKGKRLYEIEYRSPKARRHMRQRVISELSPDCPKNRKPQMQDEQEQLGIDM